MAGRAERSRRWAGRRRYGHHRVYRLASRTRGDRARGAARQQSLDIRGGHRVRRVRGGNRPRPALALVALVGVVRRGAAAQRAGRRHAHALRSGARAVRRPAGGLGRALAARRGVGAAHHRRAHGLAHQPGRDGRGPVGHRTPGARAAGRHGDRRQQDPRSPVRPRHPRIRRGPAVVGAGPSPVGGRGARRAHFPRPGRAALTGLLPGGAGPRAQPRAGAARRDARRDAGARHDHSGRAAGGRRGEPGGRGVLVRVAPTPARRRRRAPRPAAGQPFHLREPRRVLLTRRGRARRQRTGPPPRPGPGTDDAGQSRRARRRRRGAAGRLRTGGPGRRRRP